MYSTGAKIEASAIIYIREELGPIIYLSIQMNLELHIASLCLASSVPAPYILALTRNGNGIS